MRAIVSLLGPSGSGKSTLAENLSRRLETDNLSSVTIKKDDAIRQLSLERFGRVWVGYSPLRALLPGGYTASDLHGHLNQRLKTAVDDGIDVGILEGGTRTPRAQAETLSDLETIPFGLVVLNVPISHIRQRLIGRKRNHDREDDYLPLMLCKLAGQYGKALFASSHIYAEGNIVIDATQGPEEVAADTYQQLTARFHLADSPPGS